MFDRAHDLGWRLWRLGPVQWPSHPGWQLFASVARFHYHVESSNWFDEGNLEMEVAGGVHYIHIWIKRRVYHGPFPSQMFCQEGYVSNQTYSAKLYPSSRSHSFFIDKIKEKTEKKRKSKSCLDLEPQGIVRVSITEESTLASWFEKTTWVDILEFVVFVNPHADHHWPLRPHRTLKGQNYTHSKAYLICSNLTPIGLEVF